MLTAFLEALPGGIFGLGMVLVWKGLRSRVIDDHPICRKCGYDLHGLPDSTGRCPECGSDLSGTNAIRIGHIERRWRLAGVGAALVACLLGYSGAPALLSARGSDINRYKPVWWLKLNTEQRDNHRAIEELTARVTGGKLTPQQVRDIAGMALQSQAKAKWATDTIDAPLESMFERLQQSHSVDLWRDFIGTAHDAGALPPDLWAQYVHQAADFRWFSRRTVRQGDRIPIWLEQAPKQGSRPSLGYYFRPRLQIDGKIIEVQFRPSDKGMWYEGRGNTSFEVAVDDPALRTVPVGKHDATLVIDVNFYNVPPTWNMNPLPVPPPSSIASQQFKLPSMITFTSADSPPVKLISGAQFRPLVQAAMNRASCFVNGDEVAISLGIGPEWCQVPAGLAHRLFLRSEDQEWELGSCRYPQGVSCTWQASSSAPGGGWLRLRDSPQAVEWYYAGAHGTAKDFTADRADIILRPSPELAAQTIDIDSMWNEEIILKDVPVTRKK